MMEIKPKSLTGCSVSVPGSKSYTHRIIIAVSLADGPCVVENGLQSEDTLLTIAALRQMGVDIDIVGNQFNVMGKNGILKAPEKPVYLGNSGTSMRLLAGVAALCKGVCTLTGSDRMKQRPIQDLLDALSNIGVEVKSTEANGCPPIEIFGGSVKGGKTGLRCKISSQFLSSLLLIGPYTKEGIDIRVTEGPVSKPYIDMTVEVMQRCNVIVEREGYDRFNVPGGQIYKAGTYIVEPDCSQAGYFWGAAAITGARIKVLGINKNTLQGDVQFAQVLGKMGCIVEEESDGISVKGGEINAIDVDMADMPDMVPTLAVVAAFAKGTSHIENVAHLKAKESDRLGSVVNELIKMGVDATCTDTGMTIKGGNPKGAEIKTYNDHRLAMSFAMAGLKVPGIIIHDEQCVDKSFPTYWEVFSELH
jgi:3-phosphoshikimate 1-carboxyvinyltransferase